MKKDDLNITNNESDNSSLNTNYNIEDDDNETENNKKSSFSSSSKSLFSSFEKGKTNPNKIQKQKKLARENFCHINNCFLIKMKWFYSHFGFHRFIELIFKCDRCQNKFYISMEKTQRGKKLNIQYQEFILSKFLFSSWTYIPKNQITYDICERYFDEASGDWTLITNNCKDFANYIWENIKKRDKDM